MQVAGRGKRKTEGKRVFISHAREDASLARTLVETLRGAGFEPWFDVEQVHPGENVARAMGDAMESAEAIVVLVSKASLRSPQSVAEWNFAIGSKKHAGRVLPVLTPGTEIDAVPWILKHIQHLRSGRDWNRTTQQVADTRRELERSA